MISSLSGVVSRKESGAVEIEVGGVGYLVWTGERFLREIKEGDETRIYTYMAVGEKEMSLYGFLSREEVGVFKYLISVSGVGPKSAALILGKLKVEEILRAVSEADTKVFEQVKGIGKKAAQKIIIELKSKVGGLKDLDLSGEARAEKDEVYEAMKNLGFSLSEVERVVVRIPIDLVTVEDKLSWCLRNLG